MTQEEVDILLQEESQEILRRYGTEDPAQVALRLKQHGALLATQLKYRQRARVKLPSYYRAGCILPPLAFEQSSSEAVAAQKHYGGTLCVDLTCGLGVDSYHFSTCFDRVIAVERDPVTARVAASNFVRLGADNVEVVNDSAEHFIDTFSGKADLIYLDPARRGEGNRKLFLLEECSPNVIALLPKLLEKARRIVIKISPLFDVEEAFRLFGENITVEVISAQGECKEVVVDLFPESNQGVIRVTMTGCGSLTFLRREQVVDSLPAELPYRYLLIPDVALCKARLVRRYAIRLSCYAVSSGGYCLANEVPERFFGRVYPIREFLPYQPKRLKLYLKEKGILRCNLLKKEFPLSSEALSRALGIVQGGTDSIAFTRIEGALYALLLDLPMLREENKNKTLPL